MDNFNIIDFFFDVIDIIIKGANSLWNILNYNIPISNLLVIVGKIVNFFGGTIDLSQFENATISVMTIAGVSLGIIIIIVIIKKIIPFF